MHDWPQCYRACDCDGEDTWNEWPDRKVTHCAHGCEPEYGREADEAYEDDRNE